MHSRHSKVHPLRHAARARRPVQAAPALRRRRRRLQRQERHHRDAARARQLALLPGGRGRPRHGRAQGEPRRAGGHSPPQYPGG